MNSKVLKQTDRLLLALPRNAASRPSSKKQRGENLCVLFCWCFLLLFYVVGFFGCFFLKGAGSRL